MDRQEPKGCQQPATAGISEGSTGGSVEAGGCQIPGGKAPFVPGQSVYLRWQGQWLRTTVTNIFDFGGAIEVANGTGTFTVTAADLITEAKYLQDRWDDNQETARKMYRQLLAVWPEVPDFNKVSKRNKWIAEKLQMPARNVAAQVRACIHFKLIEDKHATDDPNLQTGEKSTVTPPIDTLQGGHGS